MMPAHAKICPSTRLTTGCYCTSRRERFELDAGVDTAASDLSGRNVDGPNTCPANLPRRFTILKTLKLQTFESCLGIITAGRASSASHFALSALLFASSAANSRFCIDDLLVTATAQHQIHRANEKQATGSSSKPCRHAKSRLSCLSSMNKTHHKANPILGHTPSSHSVH
ncbi:hypothetical protein GGI35DRAFT_127871 [Trichoderma velutinum]